MKFIDLSSQYARIKTDVQQRINAVLEHGQYIMGPEVIEMEAQLANYVGVKHCIGVSSGTDALLMALMALGIGRDDEVIMPPFSFFATAEVVVLLGAKPVYVDIDPLTYNIDANLIDAAIGEKTKAIMPVSLYGQCADMDKINTIASAHHIPVIEDAAQSFGATYKGKRSCGLSTIGCTSFFPTKPLGCYGDGGACFTDDENLATAMREIRIHGQAKRYCHTRVGINGRLDTLQAAVILAKLPIFDDELQQRQAAADCYTLSLSDKFTVPVIAKDNTSAWAQYTLRVENREAFCEQLKQAGIPSAVHYPVTLNQQPCLIGKDASTTTVFPHAELAAKQVVSLPFWAGITEAECQQVVMAIEQSR